MEKTCARCKEVKPLEEFYRDRAKKDGRSSYCKLCDLLTSRERRDRIRGRGRVNIEWSEALFLEKLAARFPYLRLASPYVKSTESVCLECLRCGNRIRMRPRDVDSDRFQGYCKECLRLKKAREFIAGLLKAGYFPQFTEDDYQRRSQPLPVKCPYGNLFRATYQDFMATTRPPQACKCSECKQPKPRKFRSELEARADLEEAGFIVVGPYVNTSTHVIGYWKECGHYTYQMPKCVFLRKQGCKPCYDKRRSEIAKAAKKV